MLVEVLKHANLCGISELLGAEAYTLKQIQLERWEYSCPLFDLVEFWSQ